MKQANRTSHNTILEYSLWVSEQIEKIKKSVCALNSDIVQNEIFDFNVKEIIDRILNYTNRKELPVELERIIAKAIINIYKKIENEQNNNGEEEKEISSISDNGQSISFSDKVKTYMINSSDDDLFFGFLTQINRFIKVKVVGEDEYTKQLQESNS